MEGIVEERPNENDTDYTPFIKSIQQEDRVEMKMFIDQHPGAITAKVFPGGRAALHYAIFSGKKRITMSLVELMTESELETLDEDGYTALARAAEKDYPGVLDLLKLMIGKNRHLPGIGYKSSIPVNVASCRGNKNTTRFLYHCTRENGNAFGPEYDVELLIQCINTNTFDIAIDLVRRYPYILLHQNCVEVNPIQALAKTFPVSSREREHQHSRYEKISEKSTEMKEIHSQYHDFLNLVCAEVSTFDIDKLTHIVYPAIREATEHGNANFINEIIRANPDSLYVCDSEGRSMFWYAVQFRQEKIFSLIYEAAKLNDHLLLGFDHMTQHNILHLVAELPSPVVLDRISSSSVLQLQREVLWFKEVWSLVDPSDRESRNDEGLTPRQLFSRTHADMISAGEKLIKETATSSTVVGALIVTIMFAAAFTVPGGNNQEKGYPIFANKILFKLFIMCDVLSLSSAATSILVFLTILSNSYAEEDFLFHLPRRLMIGVVTLFSSIATMMMTFCLALALMLNGSLLLLLPIAFVTSAPVVLFSKSMFPLVSEIFRSTFGSIFDRNTKLPARNREQAGEETMNRGIV